MKETGEKESSRNKLSFKKGLGFLPLPLFLNLFLNRFKKKKNRFLCLNSWKQKQKRRNCTLSVFKGDKSTSYFVSSFIQLCPNKGKLLVFLTSPELAVTLGHG